MISIPSTASLQPHEVHRSDNGNIYFLHSDSTPLVKLDLLHEAGSAYQSQPLCAAAANRLFTKASATMTSREVAEFLDYRGIIVEHNPDIFTCHTTFYFLQKYAGQLLPLLGSLLREPAFPQEDFEAWRLRRRQELLTARRKTSKVAQRMFYQTLFGDSHPLGTHAEPEDADRLTRDAVVEHFHAHYHAPMDIVLAGNVGGEEIEQFGMLNGATARSESAARLSAKEPKGCFSQTSLRMPVPGAVQTSLRVGRILPLAWDDIDYARLMLLTTALGGYFGSRLMSNLREDKGYTYGINARTQIFRGAIVFYITADVAGGTADNAEQEIRTELKRLCDEPLDKEELEMVKTVMVGDFIRSVDGIFERSERLCHMIATQITEQLTENLNVVVETTTAGELQDLAARYLAPDTMLYCQAGV